MAATRQARRAAQLLTDVYSSFTEGFETADLRAARELCEGLTASIRT